MGTRVAESLARRKNGYLTRSILHCIKLPLRLVAYEQRNPTPLGKIWVIFEGGYLKDHPRPKCLPRPLGVLDKGLFMAYRCA